VKALRTLLRDPRTWLAAFAVWFGTLWWLSSQVRHFPPGLDFRFSDKAIHFGYFLAGGFSAAAFFYRRKPDGTNWDRTFLLAILAAGFTGALDEWHQSWVPGRSGNDLPDFHADLLGSMAGALLLRACRRWIA
jgi:VanZ family protein